MARPSYVPVPGSDRLRTHKRGDSAAAVVERAPAASVKRVIVHTPDGDVQVGPALLQGPQLPLLLDVTDRLLPLLSCESAIVYLHLYRLAVRDGKNAARVSLSELSRRTSLAGRRLNKAIADAVAAGALTLVDRTRDGTLYRVVFPDELFGEAPSSASKPAPTLPSPAPAPTTSLSPSPSPSPASVATSPTPAATSTLEATALRSVGDVCRWFVERHGESPGRRATDVAELVLALLEEGHTFRAMPALLDRFVERAPQTTPLRDLPRILARS